MEYSASPYKTIPPELLDGYTMNGQIPVIHWYLDGKNELDQQIWTKKYIQKFMESFTRENVFNGRVSEPYPGASRNIMYAINKYGISNKKVAVIGSLVPWIEAMLLNHNNTVTTVEYNVPNVDFDGLNAISYWDFQKSSDIYDCIITYSSVEHSGLGRYGDPLDPDGDIKTVNDIHKKLKKMGLLIWGAPTGHDALVWNAHRIYGKIRMTLLFREFEDLEWVNANKRRILNMPLRGNAIQPVIIFRKIQK